MRLGDKIVISYSKLDEIDHSWCKKARGIQFFKPFVNIPLRSRVMVISHAKKPLKSKKHGHMCF